MPSRARTAAMDVYQWESGFTHDELVGLIKDAGRTYARIRWLLDHPQIESLVSHSVIHALEATLELCGGPTRAEGERWNMVLDAEMGLDDL